MLPQVSAERDHFFSGRSSTIHCEVSMSHIVSIRTQVRDQAAVAAACQRLGLPSPIQGTAKLFSSEASGLLIELPNWRYPIVIDVIKGEIAFDNFNGHWGEQQQLDRFVQIYSVEKAKLEARKQGHSVSEHTLSDGSIKVQIIAA